MHVTRMLSIVMILTVVFWLGIAWSAFGKTVYDDTGGPVQARLDEMQRMDGVRIVGRCYSACTMFLGLPDTCVSPHARLGFHSPGERLYGYTLPLPRAEWEQVTRMMAEHYPAPLAAWFMAKARYETDPMIITGAELISIGVKECQN